MDKPKMPPAKENAVKVEVTEDMRDAGSSQYSPDCSWRDNVEMAFAAMLAHPDCQRQLRDMVLAAVPEADDPGEYSGDWRLNDLKRVAEAEQDFRTETLANINACSTRRTAMADMTREQAVEVLGRLAAALPDVGLNGWHVGVKACEFAITALAAQPAGEAAAKRMWEVAPNFFAWHIASDCVRNKYLRMARAALGVK